jgi:hypothetical protein
MRGELIERTLRQLRLGAREHDERCCGSTRVYNWRKGLRSLKEW